MAQGASWGCYSIIKLDVFAWSLFGHKQNFKHKYFGENTCFFMSNSVLLAFVTSILIANEHGQFFHVLE